MRLGAPLKGDRRSRLAAAAYALAGGGISIALLSLVAEVARQPFVFPSLGPTAYLLFASPRSAEAAPRNAVLGHLVGVACGYVALAAFGLPGAGSALATGVTAARVGAAGLSLGLTAGLMVALRVNHAPAGATTLIVSLGLLSSPEQLAVLMLGVVLLVALGVAINRAAGIAYPIWGSAARATARTADDGASEAPDPR